MSKTSRPLWGRILGAGAALVLLVGIPVAIAGGPGRHGGFGKGHHDRPESAEELREHMDFGASRVLNMVDADDAQAAQVDAVLDELAPKLFALRGRHEGIRDTVQNALTSDTVDRAALEQARQDGLDLADEATALLMDGLADAADALRPDQRQELADTFQKFHR